MKFLRFSFRIIFLYNNVRYLIINTSLSTIRVNIFLFSIKYLEISVTWKDNWSFYQKE